MERITLKDGVSWIEVRSPDEVTVRGRRSLQTISLGMKDFILNSGLESGSKIEDVSITEEQAENMMRLQEATLLALVANWSLPYQLTSAGVGDMPAGLYDEISAIIAPVGAEIADLDTRATMEPDPKASSGSSEPSDGLSRVG